MTPAARSGPGAAATPRTRNAAPQAVAETREAAPGWAATPLAKRLEIVRRLRERLGDDPAALAATADLVWRCSSAETLTAEVLPLLDACRFLERRAATVLGPRRLGRRWRPAWLFGSTLEIRREPLGVVLVIGPSNYPILLAGVQTLQALAAGNTVVVKPGRGAAPAARYLEGALEEAGLPSGCLRVLPEEVEEARAAIAAGVDKVILTGSAATGRSVLRDLAARATPAVVELSGCDAAIVCDDADLALTARGLAFGIGLNSGFTCIAPRRLLVAEAVCAELERRLAARLESVAPTPLPASVAQNLRSFVARAIDGGGRIVAGAPPAAGACSPLLLADVDEGLAIELADLPAPVATIASVGDDEEALRRVAECPYRLGLSVFGEPHRARALARRAGVGVAVINDMIVPTADPRVPFGGRGASGFGVTRGAEGLRELTATKAVVTRAGRFRPHFDPVGEVDAPLFAGFIQALHGSSAGRRGRGALRVLREGRARQGRARRSRAREAER